MSEETKTTEPTELPDQELDNIAGGKIFPNPAPPPRPEKSGGTNPL